MDRETTVTLALVLVLAVAGCAGTPAPGTPVADSATETPDSTPTETATTTEPTTSTATPTPLDSLPSPSRCLTDAAPRPAPVDGVEASVYPEPPADIERAAVVDWVGAFERAYFRNDVLAGAADIDNQTLTEVTISVEGRGVTRTEEGYAIRLSDFGASNYASGLHGDHWADVGYVVTATRLVRVPVDGGKDLIRAEDGTPVVDCR